jgi:hypothetical protein
MRPFSACPTLSGLARFAGMKFAPESDYSHRTVGFPELKPVRIYWETGVSAWLNCGQDANFVKFRGLLCIAFEQFQTTRFL